MAVVVTDNCLDCRFTECVAVCPVSCFHQDERMVYVDPIECIACRACLTACPVNAIFDVEDLPADKSHWIEINAERASQLPAILEKQVALPNAETRKASYGF
ncbi:ferredoxin family protein [Bradyrhizobium erythrophlei]|jgi:ferredoxin|uniref:Ferredoxin n=1 Tax=Bradyrhizobium erythrophlei TaxID=1437360 RepID=A0A1M5SC32_9BRAD|nr:ferredoxin family protein [Bradyrhizobium erythrophlei]SHH36021.1 ferredoxin [Bradyrhizobium erythrophlei]